jgi:hypothetical protein
MSNAETSQQDLVEQLSNRTTSSLTGASKREVAAGEHLEPCRILTRKVDTGLVHNSRLRHAKAKRTRSNSRNQTQVPS